MDAFQCRCSVEGAVAQIEICGHLGHEDIATLEKAMKDCLAKSVTTMTVDLRKAEFLPSICFGLLITTGESAAAKGCQLRVRLTPHTARLARSIGVGQMMEIVTD